MNANMSASACDPQRLESFLSGDLSAAEERDFTLHLNACEGCRSALAEQAAEPEIWREAAELLRPDEIGVADGGGIRHEQNSLQIQNVLDALGPTDDPEWLGRLGGYEISGVVGAGGMGVVLKASDRSLDRTVAIKVLAPHLASSGAARKRFAREAKAAAAVLHPNVIAIHSVSNDEALPYLVMPYVRGTSLQKRLDNEGPLSLQEILRIGAQIAAGLAAAHAQGLVHRDIKPANILLEEGIERVTITDFGLARAADDATITHSGMIAGTPQFMSPEQARGEAVDPRSDLFSLGSVLYAICTGRPPFRAETSYGVMRRITDDEPRPIREINPDIPQWLCQLIGKLMAKQAADRYQSAAEVAELLEACLAHVQQPTVAKLPAELQPAPRSSRFSFLSRRRSGVLAMIAALGLGLLGLLAWQATEAPDIAGNWSGEEWGQVILKKTADGEYSGTYSDTFKERPGTIEVKWSRLERRYKGNWREGQERSGKISLRLVDEEIRGAWTTSEKSGINPGTPELADLTWRRSQHAGEERKTDKGVAKLVLVFFDDQSRRAIPCLVVNAEGTTFAIAAGPATVVPDGTAHAVDSVFIEVAGKEQSIPVEYDSRSTTELHVYRAKDQLEGLPLKEIAAVAEGDSVTPVSPSRVVPKQANVVGLGRGAKFELPDRQIERWYEGLIELDQTFPEGTPLFKDDKLVGLTLLGSRFVGEKAKKSYLVPADRIIELCKGLEHETAPADDAPGIRVRVLLDADTHSREVLRTNIGFDQLSIMARGIKGTVNGKPLDNIEAVMAHGCRLERFDETERILPDGSGPKKYWRATLFVPQDSKSDGSNLELSQQRIDGMLKEGVQFWLDHLRKPQLHGTVTNLKEQELVEISLGADDGVREGDVLYVFRAQTYLGKIIIQRPAADQSVARIDSRNGEIQRGDRVVTAAPPAALPSNKLQLKIAAPQNMKVAVADQRGNFGKLPSKAPARLNLVSGQTYRMRLSDIPAREGAEFYPSVEIGPTTSETEAFLAHNAIPVEFTEEDFEQALAGNLVTKVIYLPDRESRDLSLPGGVETLVSTRIDPGKDPIAEADRRGSILAVIRLGNKEIELPDGAKVMLGGALPKGLEFLAPYKQLHKLSLDMTEKEFLAIVESQKLKVRKSAADGKTTYSIPTGDGHPVIVMFSDDAEKCRGIQRLRGEEGVPDAANNPLQFSEPKEIVLSAGTSKFMLDFETDKTMDMPATVGRPEEKGMDVLTDQVQPYHYPKKLIGRGLQGVEVKSSDWDASVAEVRRALASDKLEPLKQMDLGPEKHPTYFFKTRDGAWGIFQLLEIVDEPKGIRLRYKTVNVASAKARSNPGKIVIDLHGVDISKSAGDAKLLKLIKSLNALEEVTVNTHLSHQGERGISASVRDPYEICANEAQESKKESTLQAAINEALRAGGISAIRWETEAFDPAPEASQQEAAVAKLVLVFFDDESRRAVPCLVLNAGGATFAITAGPATVVPNGTVHAVDRTFIELAGKEQPIPVEYDRRSTTEFRIYRIKDPTASIELKETASVTEGDPVTAVSMSRVAAKEATVVGVGRRTKFELPDRKVERWYEDLIEVDETFPEGTPLFKRGKLVGLTILGSRFTEKGAKKSYVIPAARIVDLCALLGLENAADSANDEGSVLSKGLKFLAPHPQLHKLSLDMTEKEFLAIVESQKLKVSKSAADGKITYSIPTGDGHTVIVMFSDDSEKCRGIQRLRGEAVDEPDKRIEDKPSAEQRGEILTPKQIVENDRKLYHSRQRIVVQFQVSSAVRIAVKDEKGVDEEAYDLYAEEAPKFSVRVTKSALSALKSRGVDDVDKHFRGKWIRVEGTVYGVGLDLISRPDTLWTYHVDVNSLDQLSFPPVGTSGQPGRADVNVTNGR